MRSFAITLLSLGFIFGTHCSVAQIETASLMASVPLSVTVDGDQLILNAIVQDEQGTLDYRIYKRERNAGSDWGTYTTLTTWPHTVTLSPNDHKIYEFKVIRRNNAPEPQAVGYGYICAGRESSASEWSGSTDHYMGTVVVLIENTLANAIPTEIQLLAEDLRSDGWTPMIYAGINSNDAPSSVKALVIAAAEIHDVKAVLILGRVPVPISYNETVDPDGHVQYQPFVVDRLWPADGYYGDLDGVWSGPGLLGAHFNMANYPSEIEIPVGRIDLRDMPGVSEASLTTAYIQRAHDYRTRVILPKRRGIVFDNLVFDVGVPWAAAGYNSIAPLVGNTIVTSGALPETGLVQANQAGWPFKAYVNLQGSNTNGEITNTGSFLWTYSAGGGSMTNADNIGSTTDYSASTFSFGGVFNMTCGSYMMRWQEPNNFIRAPLLSGHALTNVWSGNPNWYFHNMGMGESISRSIHQSMNNHFNGEFYVPQSSWIPASGVEADIHMGLMGDPTLRMHYIKPPTNLLLSDVSGNVHLQWDPPVGETVEGYHVYRMVNGAPVLLNETFTNNTSVVLNGLGGFPMVSYNEYDEYMVRATRLETTPSGSYYNLSIGSFNTLCDFDIAQQEYHINGSVSWTDDLKVRGRVIVNDGATLTIDDATIRFAPSSESWTTDLTVMPGGTLNLINGAILTSTDSDCGTPGMWNGVKMLSTIDNWEPIVSITGNSRITNAYTALLGRDVDPADPLHNITNPIGGSLPSLLIEDAHFLNNQHDIILRPAQWGGFLLEPNIYIRNTRFATEQALNNSSLKPVAHIFTFRAGMEIAGCTFENTSGLDPTEPSKWGIGILSHDASPRIIADGSQRGAFNGLEYGVKADGIIFTSAAFKLDENDFTNCARGVFLIGMQTPRVTRNTFSVPDLQPDAPQQPEVTAAYGSYLYGCPGFEFEENSFIGATTQAHPRVGAAFKDCGPDGNRIYNNSFNRFANTNDQSAGLIVMGFNGLDDNGLQIKCNDFSATNINSFDVAFTGPQVIIAGQQGSEAFVWSPAGNTFADVGCTGNDEAQHLYLEAGSFMNVVSYWHHEQEDAIVRLIPDCENLLDVGFSNSTLEYTKSEACPVQISGMVGEEEDVVVAGNANGQFTVLREVYTNWRDGGNTEGLADFVRNPANDSYAVRNQLMLVAPKVSKDVWVLVFQRQPAMNPWHFAQALIANSPLEPEVQRMLEESDIDEFYKQLVRDNQNGISMHSIYRSEIAYFQSVKSTALQDMVYKVIVSGDTVKMQTALDTLNSLGLSNKDQYDYSLHLAMGSLTAARQIVNDKLSSQIDDKSYWEVQDMLLALMENQQDIGSLTGTQRQQLQSIAAQETAGAATATSILVAFGQSFHEPLILPNRSKSLAPDKRRSRDLNTQMLTAYPNPSNGPVYIVYDVPEGVEKVSITVMDTQGRLIQSTSVPPQGGIFELTIGSTSTGMHIVNLTFDGIRIGSSKVNVVR